MRMQLAYPGQRLLRYFGLCKIKEFYFFVTDRVNYNWFARSRKLRAHHEESFLGVGMFIS